MSKTAEPELGSPKRFVGFLYSLARQEDRGALAALRRGLGRTPDAAMLRLAVPYLPEDRPWEHATYFLVASLFGLYPEPGGRGNFGETFRRLRDREKRESESAVKRFIALLNSRREDLPHRLRQAVALAKSKEEPVNWHQLLADLLQWDSETRHVQTKWARSYWGRRAEEETDRKPPEAAVAAGGPEKGV